MLEVDETKNVAVGDRGCCVDSALITRLSGKQSMVLFCPGARDYAVRDDG